MKKTLALFLAVVMTLSCMTSLFMFGASAEADESLPFSWANSWKTVDSKKSGCWQSNAIVPAAEQYSYQYATDYRDGTLKMGVKFAGTLTGTAASMGNGNGTNLRIWIKDPTTGYVSYNYFLDVAYNGTSFVSRLAKNTNAAGNAASWPFAYDTEGTRPYTLTTAITEAGAEFEILFDAAEFGDPETLEIVYTVSNKITTNYALYSTSTFNAASAWPADALKQSIMPWGGEKILVDAKNTGIWQAAIPEEGETFSYTFNYDMDDDNLYVEVDYTGTFTGTAASYGNGAGTMIRLWFYDSAKTIDVEGVATACTLYTNFMDISYADGVIKDRLMVNTKPTGNTAAGVTGMTYTDENKPYTIVNTLDAEAGTWCMKLTLPLNLVCGDKANLQFQPSVSNIINGGNNALYYGTTKDPYTKWTVGSAVPHVAEYPVIGGAVAAADDKLVKTNVNLGSTQIDKIVSEAIPQYSSDMNDGVTATDGGAFSYGAPWYSFYKNADKTTLADPANMTGYATFDLGSVKEISELAMQIYKMDGAVVTAYASVNNIDWYSLGNITYENSAVIQTPSLVLENVVNARYIKFKVVTGGMFFMVSEIMIYQYDVAQKINIGSINSYGWGSNGYPVILAYGKDSTPVEKIGGAWFTWWFQVKAAWSQADHAFVVNAVAAPGSPDYASWVLGDREVALICYSGNEDTPSLNAVKDLAVGDKLYMYGCDFTNASGNDYSTATEGVYSSDIYFYSHKAMAEGQFDVSDVTYPGKFTDVDVPQYTTATNIAGLGILRGDAPSNATYNGDIIDGVSGPTGYTNVWRAYTKGTSNSIVELDKEYTDIGSISVCMWPANKSGIVKPDSIKFYASIDGYGWLDIGSLDISDEWFSQPSDTSKWVTLTFEKFLDAKYIKMEVTTSGSFSFISEVAVNTLKELSTYNFTHSYSYTTESVNLIPNEMGATLDAASGLTKNHEWWDFAAIEWSAKENAYVVTTKYHGDGTKTGTDFGDVAIPEFGFLMGSHYGGGEAAKAFATFVQGLEVGTKLYFYNVDMDKLSVVGTELTETFVSVAPIDGLTAYAPDVIQILRGVGFAGGDCSIFTRMGELTTIDDIAAYVRGVEIGDNTDYNYYYLITVDAENIVTSVNKTLGRPAGDKGEIVVPEGGYAIAVNAANAKFARFGEICVGETVTLIGVDLAALAANTGAVIVEDDPDTTDVDESSVTASTVVYENAYFGVGHTHAWGETTVVAPTCTEEGYDSRTCTICGEILKDNIVPATGHTSDEIVHVKEPTCVAIGYSYNICTVCGEELKIDGTDVAATGVHTYVSTDVGSFVKHTCSVCGKYYFTDADDKAAIDLQISHFNAYNWNTFQGAIYMRTNDKITPSQVLGRTLGGQIAYAVKVVDGQYYAYEFFKDADNVEIPEGGFVLTFAVANSGYATANNGALLGYYLLPDNMTFGASWGIDTGFNPAKHLYAIAAGEADFTDIDAAVALTEGLVEADYSAESWAAYKAAINAVADAAKITYTDIATNADLAAKFVAANFSEVDQTALDNWAADITDAVDLLKPAVILGDVDGDGTFGSSDLILASQADAGTVTFTAAQEAAADVNGDGEYTSADLIIMAQYDAGQISVWPADEQ